MSSTECPNRNTLFDYLVGKLPDEDSDSLSSHLEACPDCQAELATLSDIEDTLIGRLRGAADPEPYLDESECGRAIAKAKVVGDEPGVGQMGTVPASPPETTETSLSMQLGEYRLIERLGSGGMGAVYKALHNRLDRVVALKILPRSRTEDQRAVVRFEREMKAIGRLDHPHIVRAYDAREIEGRLVLVMEFVEGLDLGKIIRRLGQLGAPDACELARQAALGLQAAHEHGMVHRDVKPSNLMLTPEGEVKLLDLGLARFHRDPATEEEMTGTGQAMGTADYMAPEQTSDSRAVDIRADIYGLGATLYKLLSGRAPFSGPEYQGAFEKMLAHRQAPLPPIGQFCPDIPEGLVAVLNRMLAKDPADRYSTPAEVAEALAPFCAGSDLPALLRRAESATSSPLPLAEGQARSTSSPLPLGKGQGKGRIAAASRRWRTIVAALVALLLVGGIGVALGILIHINIDKEGNATVDVSSDTPNGKSPQNADLQLEIARLKGNLASQKAILKNVDTADVPAADLDAMLQRDPAAREIAAQLAERKRVQSDRGTEVKPGVKPGSSDRSSGDVHALEEQYDARVAAIRAMARQKRRQPVEMEIVKLEAQLKALSQARQQGKQSGIAASDEKAIQGTWEVVSSTFKLVRKSHSDADVTPEQWKQTTKIVITADAFKILGKHVVNQSLDYRMNPDAKPKIIDLQDGGYIYLGIFQLTGNELKICVSRVSEEKSQRPSEFWAEYGSDKELLVLRRVGDVVVSEDEEAIQGTWQVESPSLSDPNNTGVPLFAHDQQVVISPRTVKLTQPEDSAAEGDMVGGGGKAWFYESKYTLDPTSQPKIIDFSMAGGTSAIYELQGDRLTLCFYWPATQGHVRPTKLAADEQTHATLVVLKRVSKPAAESRSQGTPAETTKEAALQFAPVIERVVNARSEGKGSDAIDLAGGKLVDLPKDFDKLPADKQGRWCAENGVDLVVDRLAPGDPFDDQKPTLVPERLKLAAIDGQRWENVTEKELRSALASLTPGHALIHYPEGADVQIADVQERGGVVSYVLRRSPPLTFAFQTRNGELGILQVIRYTEDPRGMRIRYKLAQLPSVAPGAVGASTVNAAAELRALYGRWNVVRVEKGKDANASWGQIMGLQDSPAPLDPSLMDRIDFNATYEPPLQFLAREALKGNWAVRRQGFKYRIDPTANPKTIDLLADNNANVARGEPAALGIYTVDGDRLTICLTPYLPELKSEQRPKNFAMDPNSGDVVFALDRGQISEDEKAIKNVWWTVASQVEDGKPTPEQQLGKPNPDQFRNKQCLFDEYDLQIIDATTPQSPILYGSYTFDSTKPTKTITIFRRVLDDNGYKEVKLQGIYKIDGRQLTIAYRKGDKPPEKFESSPGSGVTLLVLKRNGPQQPTNIEGIAGFARDQASNAVSPTAELRALQGPWKVVRVEKGKEANAAWGAIAGDGTPLDPATTDRLAFDKSFADVSLRLIRPTENSIAAGIETQFESADCVQGFDYRIDPTKTPATIDFIVAGDHPTEMTTGNQLALGIYKIENNQLTICLRRTFPEIQTNQRPTSFTVDPSSGDILFVLNRYQPTDDEKAIQFPHQWTLVENTVDGRPVAADKAHPIAWMFENNRRNRFSSDVSGGDSEGRKGMVGVYFLDPAKQPKTITLFDYLSDFTLDKKAEHGIYKLEGDRLTIAFRKADKPPENFESKPGSGVTLMVLKRSEMPKPTEGMGGMNAGMIGGMGPGMGGMGIGGGMIGGTGPAGMGGRPLVNAAAALKAIKGSWKVVRIEKGKDAEETWPVYDQGDFTAAKLDRFHFGEEYLELVSLQDGSTATVVYHIDPAGYFKTIDLSAQDTSTGPGRLSVVGVYEFPRDQLWMRLTRFLPSVKSDQRPKSTRAESGTGDILYVLERYQLSADEKAIQGDWSVARQIVDGTVAPDSKERSSAKLRFSDDYFVDASGSMGLGSPGWVGDLYHGVFSLNPNSTPKSITLFNNPLKMGDDAAAACSGPEKLSGIYKFDGDRLTIAYRKGDKPPEKFESKPGSRVALLEFKKIGPPKANGKTGIPQGQATTNEQEPGYYLAHPSTGISLAKAVRSFNAEVANQFHEIDQPALTVDEVIAAIKSALGKPEKLDQSRISAESLQALKGIVESRKLPNGFELFNEDPGPQPWSARLLVPVDPDESFPRIQIVIRDKAASPPPSAKEAPAKPVVLRTATVTRGNIAATIGATGTIEPEEVLDVGAQVAGQIVRFGDDPRGASDPSFKGKSIDFNSPVQKDMILAMIDPTPYKTRVDQKEAELLRAKAELALAEAKAKQEPAAIGKASVEAAKATLLQRQSALDVAKTDLAYTVIRSPVEGVIIDRRVNVGQNVGTDSKAPCLFLIAKDLKKMQIWASVDEADIARIHKGVEVRFTVDAFPKNTYKGTVSQIRANAARTQNVVTYTVVIAFENPDLKLMPYLTANVQFQIESHANVLRAPNAALRWTPRPEQVADGSAADVKQTSNRPCRALWTAAADGKHVRLVEVELGLSDQTLTEVSGKDVKEGIEVVVGEEAAKQSPAKPASLQTTKVVRGDLEVPIAEITGPLQFKDVRNVTAQVPGKIVEIAEDPRAKTDPNFKGKLIDVGASVEEGAILAKIDDAPYKAAAKKAEEAIHTVKAELDKAKSQPSGITLQQKERNERMLADSQAALEQAKTNLDSLIIRSPVKGVVLARRVNVGHSLANNSHSPTLFVIAKDIEQMRVCGAVDSGSNIRQGMEARVAFPNIPWIPNPGSQPVGKPEPITLKGTVAEIRLNSENAPKGAEYTVTVDVENPQKHLWADQQAEVSLFERHHNVLHVPREALVWKPRPEQMASDEQVQVVAVEGGGAIWVKTSDGRHVRPVLVQVLATDGRAYAISGPDVKEGMEVVVGQ